MPIYLPPLSRRSFLAGSLAAGAGVLLGRYALADDRKIDPNRWVLISDIHIGASRDDLGHGVKPAETFATTVQQVLDLDPRPVGIIVTGDLAFVKGLPENYKLVKELFRPIREAGIPMHLVLGNHDQRENFWVAFPEAKPAQVVADHRQAAVIETPLASWFLMDSLFKTEITQGLLGKEQLQWLSDELRARTDKPALLIAHHNLGGLSGVQDASALMRIAVDHKQAKAYFYGHLHEWSVRRDQEIHIVNVPATAWLFKANQPRGWVDISLRKSGATVVMYALDKKHPKHGERHELKWRA